MARLPELEQSITANYPLVYLSTHEESRGLEGLAAVARDPKTPFDLFSWSFTKGMRYYVSSPEEGFISLAEAAERKLLSPMFADKKNQLVAMAFTDGFAKKPVQMLNFIENYQGGMIRGTQKKYAIFSLLDLHPFLGQFEVVRSLRDVVSATMTSMNDVQSTVIISPVVNIPEDLNKTTTLIDLPLPDAELLGQLVDDLFEKEADAQAREAKARGKGSDTRPTPKLSAEMREQIVKAASGLTVEEALNALRKGLVCSRRLFDETVARTVRAEKKQLIRKDGTLEYYDVQESLANVGGLSLLKPWIAQRTDAFSDAARAYGLPAPKGLLMAGVPGCGKSLLAKAIANEWQLPLLRLDMGRVFSSLVGSSEERARRVIKIAESMAPVVLWIDEIDKGMSGASSSDMTDGGNTSRVITTFLTWMQEKTSPVFVVATANNIIDDEGKMRLPPELLRKGRFDEIFFVDLPNTKEREEIWKIHLRRRGIDDTKMATANIDCVWLAENTEDFSGAEIEQVVIDALYAAFADKIDGKTRALRNADLREIITSKQVKPLAQLAQKQITMLRTMAETRMRPANLRDDVQVNAFETPRPIKRTSTVRSRD